MATKDNAPGFLAKVGKFVRNPTVDWANLDNLDREPESVLDKQVLKDMIERKRQNDWVRKREFDQLRKLRKNVAMVTPELVARPSFFHSSVTSNPEGRASTLKKINDIEAQMSKQWWKPKAPPTQPLPGSSDQVTVTGAMSPQSLASQPKTLPPAVSSVPPSARVAPDGFAATELVGRQPPTPAAPKVAPAASATPAVPVASAASAVVSTVPEGVVKRRWSDNLENVSPRGVKHSELAQKAQEVTGSPDFSHSKVFAMEMGDRLADPDLEEAAIRFANGDDRGAESILLAALDSGSAAMNSAEAWAAALFDMYRSTGQEDSFYKLSMNYAQRFGRAAPKWAGPPSVRRGKAGAAETSSKAGGNPGPGCLWTSPPLLDMDAFRRLTAALADSPMPWNLDWSWLEHVHPNAVVALTDLFEHWCSNAVTLHFGGADTLENRLRAMTPSGERQINKVWWNLRLVALCAMHMQDEFELAALDYCVTYEVSPPDWRTAKCHFLFVRQGAPVNTRPGSLQAGPDHRDERNDFRGAATVPMGLGQEPAHVVPARAPDPRPLAISGELIGNVIDPFADLGPLLVDSKRLEISCAKLVRVDFPAAGSILNWAIERQAEGRTVEFYDVPRLVAAFFNVIGINEYAKVLVLPH